MRHYTLAELADNFPGIVSQSAEGVWVKVDNSVGIPIKLWSQAEASSWTSVCFIFHGAVDQEKRGFPYFEGDFLRGSNFPHSLFISIADPALALSPTLRAAWYAGTESQDISGEIALLVRFVLARVKPTRVVFFGGSVGGHAALVQSSQVPNSLCIVKNPVTAISRYSVNYVDTYRRHCWPNRPKEALERLICDDVSSCYLERRKNLIIYLQNSTDRFVTKQMIPFLTHLRNQNQLHLVCHSYPGYSGHTFPVNVVVLWIEAALSAPDLKLSSIVDVVQIASSKLETIPQIAPSLSGGKNQDNPYRGLPERAFWKLAVAKRHLADWENLWRPIALSPTTVVATGGSCFAQHIGRNLRERGTNYLDLELPPSHLPRGDWSRFGYGLYSCRYGNIYTTRQLLQLTQESLGEREPVEKVWKKNGRYFDPYRPSVEPEGLGSMDEVLAERVKHLEKVAFMWQEMDLFVFTLGLTEVWFSRRDGSTFPTAPGTIAGHFNPEEHAFINLSYEDIYSDLLEFWERISHLNPRARLLLTVSPVPLTATYRNEHVLVASSGSKATLRAVADALSSRIPGVSYFPSYEIIATHPSRGQFFNPDLRTVNAEGVRFVMQHFFAADQAEAGVVGSSAPGEIVCDEERIESVLQEEKEAGQ